jgi:hypothetical protein
MSSSLLSVTTANSAVQECVCGCARDNFLRVRDIKIICIGCFCLLGIGFAGLSSYFVYKIYKLNKKLDEFESKLENFGVELNLMDEYNDQLFEFYSNDSEQDSNDEKEEEKESVKHSHVSRSLERKRSIDVKNLKSCLNKPLTKSSKCVSFESDLDNLSYETPCSSPERVQDEIDDSIDNKYIEQYNFNESIDSLKCISDDKKKLYESDSNNFNNLIGYLRTVYCLAEKESDYEIKKTLASEAYKLAKKCVELNSKLYLSHKWYFLKTLYESLCFIINVFFSYFRLSLSAGRLTEYVGLNEKVKFGFEFKDHLDIAIKINDSDYLLYYLRGRWYFKMCNLSWLEKNAIRLLFSNMPTVTMDDAMNDFLRVMI